MKPVQSGATRPLLPGVLASFRGAFFGAGLMSGMINILALASSLYMLQVYDRVLPSRSIPTLVGLSLLVAFAFAFQGLLELIRSRILVRIATALDAQVSGPIFATILGGSQPGEQGGAGLQPLRDLDQVRSFLAGAGPTAMFDLPWTPLYVAICFVFHFWIGVIALGGAVVLFVVTLLAEALTRDPVKIASRHASERMIVAEAARRAREVLQAMGFGHRIGSRWAEINVRHLSANSRASDLAGTLGTVTRVIRIALQSGILATGAYLVIVGEATGGIMIASSIMMSRALAPIEVSIANWKGFVSARQGWARLTELDRQRGQDGKQTELGAPAGTLSVEGLSLVPPGGRQIVLQDVTFRLDKGAGLGVIGPSASGKSSLARALIGVWTPARGTVRLDGATLDQWEAGALGRHLGYLPQDMQLLDGTVGENICRFDPDASSESIIAAARIAGVHDLIVHLPEGYDTRIGEGGGQLSAGQRQRVALARALYGDPFLVVLDEPNSNLDAEGEAALTAAIESVRARGGIAVVIAHRPSALASLDQVLVLAGGRVQAFGPKAEVLAKMTKPASGPTPLKIVAAQEESS